MYGLSYSSPMNLICFMNKPVASHLLNIMQDADSLPPPCCPTEGLDKEGGGSRF